MYRRFITGIAPAFALVISATACASGPGVDRAAQETDSIFIDAVNDNYYEARVHAVYEGGQRRSLGTIGGNGGSTRTAMAWEPHSLVFEVSFIISGATYESLPLEVIRGENIEVRLPANIDQSGFFRRVARD